MMWAFNYSCEKTEFWVWKTLILYTIVAVAVEIGRLNFLGGEESPLVKNSSLMVLTLLLLLDTFDDLPLNFYLFYVRG